MGNYIVVLLVRKMNEDIFRNLLEICKIIYQRYQRNPGKFSPTNSMETEQDFTVYLVKGNWNDSFLYMRWSAKTGPVVTLIFVFSDSIRNALVIYSIRIKIKIPSQILFILFKT